MKYKTGKLISLLCICCLSLLFLSSNSLAQQRILFDQKLKTIDGNNFNFSELASNKASIIVFLLPDCPACENYSKNFNEFHEKYSEAGIKLYGVFPGPYGKPEEMRAYQRRYKIRFPLLRDPDKMIVSLLGAVISPEVFLLDNKARILYQGRVDDWMYAPGKKRREARTHDLKNAIEEFLQGKEIQVKKTRAIGCIIE
ncbi:MAG: hypothetical protein DWQ44_12435 [Bacteroidetes bacterium]|nr:MAG: hypothetical protein DWQ33_07570 [Bacteroidota bacterium]REK08083.1 MAG: hypothetical protein DWQ39_00580 [Bacteroidota bacterium]REK32288.1 MAG: hypothetical protein DWQ44_12435 [Bacteroidota bacterium]REK49521.1 MAG: hypothetical protein DWQ48_06890 [Bacteroidota bacterium]